MSGLQEILIVVLIVLGIIFLPRVLGRPMAQRPPVRPKSFRMSGVMRLSLVVSAVWLVGGIIYHRAWEAITMPFYLYGMGPVILGWAAYWVWNGINHKYKR